MARVIEFHVMWLNARGLGLADDRSFSHISVRRPDYDRSMYENRSLKKEVFGLFGVLRFGFLTPKNYVEPTL